MFKIRLILLVLLTFAALAFSQWQPLPEIDLSLTGLSPAVRADTSVHADGRIVDQDTLAGHVTIPFEGYYRFIPHIWIDSGNHQRNESFYLEMHQGNQVSLPLDPNAGPYKVIADDTVLYAQPNLYVDRDAGLFYLTQGVHEIWMIHYARIADQYPKFINYYPDGRGIDGAESVYIWDVLVVRPEPQVDAALSFENHFPDYCFTQPGAQELVPGDTMTVQLKMENMLTDGYRNAFPSGELKLALPPNFTPFDFSLPPQQAYANRSDSLVWTITQFSDSTLKEFTVSFSARLSPYAAVGTDYTFAANFAVANDRDINNNSASDNALAVSASPCSTDCFIQLYSDDADRIVNAEDSIRYVLIYGNAGQYPAANPFLNVSIPDHVQILSFDPTFQKNGNVFSRTIANLQPGVIDTVYFDGLVKHPVPIGVNALVAIGSVNFALDNDLSNNQDSDELQIGIGQYADISVTQTISTDSMHINNGVVENWAALDSAVHYTLTVKNESAYPALNVTVSDSLPERVVTEGSVQWFIPRLEAGESRQFVVNCVLKDSTSAEGTPFVSTAKVECDNERTGDQNNNKANQIFYLYKVKPLPQADIALSYMALTDTAIVYNGELIPAAFEGDLLQFRLTAVNNGPDDATNIQIRNVLPQGLENIQFDNNDFGPGDTLVWTIDQLPAGASWIVNMSAVYSDVEDKPVLLTGMARAVLERDSDQSNNSASARVFVLKKPQPDVAVSQRVASDSSSVINHVEISYVTFDEEFTKELWVHNRGNAAAIQVAAVDSLPPGIRVVQASPEANVVNGVVMWVNGAIEPGDSVLFSLTCVVDNDNLPSGHIFEDRFRAEAVNEPVEYRDNNGSVEQFYLYKKNVQPAYDLGITYTVSADSSAEYAGELFPAAVEGETLSYKMVVQNSGPNNAVNVVVKNVLPSGLSEITFDNNSYARGDTLVWIVPQILVGESWTVNMTAVYNKVTSDPVLLRATAIVYAEWDADLANNEASNRVVILKRKEFDLVVSQQIVTDSVATVNGEPWHYVTFDKEFKVKLNALNWGEVAAHNVALQYLIPSGIKVDQSSAAATVSGDTLSWAFATVAQGNSAFIELTCRVDNATLPAGFMFTSIVRGRADLEPTENLSNNSSQQKFYLYIESKPDNRRFDLSLSHFAQSDSLIEFNDAHINAVVADDPVLYHIVLQNKGPVTARDVRVSTSEPDYFDFSQFSKPAQKEDGEFYWLVDSLAAGTEWRVQFTANYASLKSLPYYVETLALVTAALDSTPANNAAAVIVAVLDSTSCDTWVSVTAVDSAGWTVEQIEPNQDITFVLDYGTRECETENVQISFVMPPDLTFLGADPEPAFTSGDTLFWEFDLLDSDGQMRVRMRAPADLGPGTYSYAGKARIRGDNDNPANRADNTDEHALKMVIEEKPELIVSLKVDPEQMDVSDSAFVSVSFSQPVRVWDVSVTLPNGATITSFGDDFIAGTPITPNIWYKLDEPFLHPQLLGGAEQDDILFTASGTSVDGVNGEASANLIVTSSNSMHLNQNVFGAGQSDLVEIHFKVAGGSDCTIALYDLAGHLITQIAKDYFQGGWNMVPWDGRRMEDGALIGSGTYVVTLETKFERYYKKLIIVR